ncbi:MAG: hypothetical protein Q4Q06_02110 [Bacteroidota bacterium]|nr:hypothetical protein [Bacteroidota bacterium]
MYNFVAKAKQIEKKKEIKLLLPSSKSISNRLLIIRYLSERKDIIEDLSDSGDTLLLDKFISEVEKGENKKFCCKNAGTTTRFLIALLCLAKGKWIVEASERMNKRPVKDLLLILKQLGANIEYNTIEHPFPIMIEGGPLESKNSIRIEKQLTSQIISALLLISPYIKGGLSIRLAKQQPSFSYIEQTIALANTFGAKISIKDKIILSQESNYQFKKTRVEKDYSSLCFLLSFVSVWQLENVLVQDLYPSDLQGDYKAIEMFKELGVEVVFLEKYAKLSYNPEFFSENRDLEFDLTNTPDVFLPLAVSMYCKGVRGKILGLSSQKVKESNRLENIARELNKMGERCSIDKDSFIIEKGKVSKEISPCFDSYNDHRIVMALIVCSAMCKEIYFDNIVCVEKSWRNFWKDVVELVEVRSA